MIMLKPRNHNELRFLSPTGQHEPVLRLQPRTSHLPAQHSHLVSLHEQFNVLRRLTPATGHDENQQNLKSRIQGVKNT